MPDDVRFTNKLPALIAALFLGAAALAVRFYSKSPTATAAFFGLLLLAALFFGYSLSIKEWCVVNPHSAFSSGFSPSLRGCLRLKGWLEL